MDRGYFQFSDFEESYVLNRASSERNLHFNRFLKKATSLDLDGARVFIRSFVQEKLNKDNVTKLYPHELNQLFVLFRMYGLYSETVNVYNLYTKTLNQEDRPGILEEVAIAHIYSERPNPLKAIEYCDSIISIEGETDRIHGIKGNAYLKLYDFCSAFLKDRKNEGLITEYRNLFNISKEVKIDFSRVSKKVERYLDLSHVEFKKGFEISLSQYNGMYLMYSHMRRGSFEKARSMAKILDVICERDGGTESTTLWTSINNLQISAVLGDKERFDKIFAHIEQEGITEWQRKSLKKVSKNAISFIGNQESESHKLFQNILEKIDNIKKGVPNLSKKFGTPIEKNNPTPEELLLHQSYNLRGTQINFAGSFVITGTMDLERPGQMPDVLITKRDWGDFHKIITANLELLIPEYVERKPELHGKNLLEIKEPEEFLGIAKQVVRKMLRTDFFDMENEVGSGHRMFDETQQGLNYLSGIDHKNSEKRGKGELNSQTNLSSLIKLGLGDCRVHSKVTQLLYQVWEAEKVNRWLIFANEKVQRNENIDFETEQARKNLIFDLRLIDGRINDPSFEPVDNSFHIYLKGDRKIRFFDSFSTERSWRSDGRVVDLKDATVEGKQISFYLADMPHLKDNDSGVTITLNEFSSDRTHIHPFNAGVRKLLLLGLPVNANEIPTNLEHEKKLQFGMSLRQWFTGKGFDTGKGEHDIMVFQNLAEFFPSLYETLKLGPIQITNVQEVLNNYNRLIDAMPSVSPYYAVKANPREEILHTLHKAGSNFDAASLQEVEMLLKIGVNPEKIIFSNTSKDEYDLPLLHQKGIKTFVSHDLDDIKKIAKFSPGSEVLIRLVADSGKNVVFPHKGRYGIKFSEAERIIIRAKKLGLNPIGVHVHHGSENKDPEMWDKSIGKIKNLFIKLREKGIDLNTIDISGGYAVGQDAPIIEKYGEVVENSISKHFGKNHGLRFISEPGRIVTSSASVTLGIVSEVRRNSPGTRFNITSSSGAKTAGLQEPGVIVSFARFNKKSGQFQLLDSDLSFPASFYDHTCDDFPAMVENPFVPIGKNGHSKVREGDMVIFRNTGAYCNTLVQPSFNAQAKPIEFIMDDNSFRAVFDPKSDLLQQPIKLALAEKDKASLEAWKRKGRTLLEGRHIQPSNFVSLLDLSRTKMFRLGPVRTD